MIDTVNLYDAKTNRSKLADWPTPYDRADLVRDEANGIAISAGTGWEIAIKRAIGKLRFGRPVVAAVLALGFDILPVDGAHAEHADSLPPHYNDPFDRLIIAQAYLKRMVLGT